MSDDKEPLSPGMEKILEIVCPEIKHAKCSHKKERNGKLQWDYWSSDSGYCRCNQCGKLLNGRWEYEVNFSPNR